MVNSIFSYTVDLKENSKVKKILRYNKVKLLQDSISVTVDLDMIRNSENPDLQLFNCYDMAKVYFDNDNFTFILDDIEIKLKSAYKKYLEDIKSFQLQMVEEHKGYYKNGKFYMYKENSRAEDMRKSRIKNKRPSNISPDYTSMMYDIEYEKDSRGRKVRNGKVFLKLNTSKRDDLLFKIKYQMLIKHTTVIFFDKRGFVISTDDFNTFKDYVMSESIDLSNGIYAKQYYHLDISNNNIKFKNYSEKGLYLNAMKYLSKNKGSKIKLTDIYGNLIVISSYKELKSCKSIIDWSKTVYWFSTTPVKANSSRWNDDIGGYWLMLAKLPNERVVYEYEIKYCVSKVIKNSLIFKLQADKSVIKDKDKKELEDVLEKYRWFSYEKCNSAIDLSSISSIIKKFYKNTILKNLNKSIRNILKYVNNKYMIKLCDTNYLFNFVYNLLVSIGISKEDISFSDDMSKFCKLKDKSKFKIETYSLDYLKKLIHKTYHTDYYIDCICNSLL